MFLISHRGNINGKNPLLENTIPYIQQALDLGYDCEIDVWFENDQLYLGHDKAEHLIDIDYLIKYSTKLWIHCKNVEALSELDKYNLNYFWHQQDDYTLTSNGFIWTYPTKKLVPKSICVLPENGYDKTTQPIGYCSDYIVKYS